MVYEIEVLKANWRSVKVFGDCSLSYIGTGMQAICIGFEAKEIVAVMDAIGVKAKSRPRILRDVSYMGRCAAEYINEQNRAAAKRNG